MKFFIKGSEIGGQGCFATQKIKKGETIAYLTGETVSLKEINKRIKEGSEGPDDPLQIDEALYIDLDEPARIFNHSCNPNAGVRGKNKLFALRDIKKDEEITYDYSTVVGKNVDWIMNCKCGSRNCRKTVGNILTIPEASLKKYKRLGALPNFIRKQLYEKHRG